MSLLLYRLAFWRSVLGAASVSGPASGMAPGPMQRRHRPRRRAMAWLSLQTIPRWLTLLSLLSFGLMAAAVHLFFQLVEGQGILVDGTGENAVRDAYQIGKEMGEFGQEVAFAMTGEADRTDGLRLAFDTAHRRADLLQDGDFGGPFGTVEAVGTIADDLSEGVYALAPVIAALPDMAAQIPAGQLRALSVEAHRLQGLANQLMGQASHELDVLRDIRRAETVDLLQAAGITVAAIVAGFVSIVTLLGLQMRKLAATGRKLVLLGRRYRSLASRARAANRAKTTFLATMSHEIRTPLNGIIGAAELMSGGVLSTPQARQLSMIRQSGDLLLEVITDVLDFTKLESGSGDFETSPVPLDEISQAVLAVLGTRASTAGVRLSVEFPPVIIGTDPIRLRQLVINLTGNAIKFTDVGQVAVRGRILENSELRVEVTDTGIGISAEDQKSLFREFNQLDGSATRRFGGTGLGLAICKRIVTGLNGRIGVVSTLGKGSTFWFELPVDRRFSDRAMAVPPRGAGAVTGQNGDKISARFCGCVLVAEDDPINSAVAEGLLAQLGMVIDLAPNGAVAQDMAEARSRDGRPYDLILMDMQMPVQNGLDTTRRLRTGGYGGRVVGLTANSFASDRQACLASGMDDFLTKPVTLAKFAAALQDAGLADPQVSPVALVPSPPSWPDERPDERIDFALFGAVQAGVGADVLPGLVEALRVEVQTLPAALDAARVSAGETGADAVLHALKGAVATLGLRGGSDDLQTLAQGPHESATTTTVVVALLADIANLNRWLAMQYGDRRSA